MKMLYEHEHCGKTFRIIRNGTIVGDFVMGWFNSASNELAVSIVGSSNTQIMSISRKHIEEKFESGEWNLLPKQISTYNRNKAIEQMKKYILT